MKTPEQIANEISLPRVISSGNTLKQLMAEAIEADRAQRNIYDLITEALDERAEMYADNDPDNPTIDEPRLAAARIREEREDDCVWDRFIGPMLDAMEEGYGQRP